MSEYFKAVKKNEKLLPQVLEHFEKEYEQAKQEVKLNNGDVLFERLATLSGNYENRMMQKSELDAIYFYFENKQRQIRASVTSNIIDKNPRSLTSSDMKTFVDGQPEMIALYDVLTEINLIRDKYNSLEKGFTTAGFNMGTLSKLQLGGMENTLISIKH